MKTKINFKNHLLIILLTILYIKGFSQVQVDVKAFLSGPYVASTGKMHDSLRALVINPTVNVGVIPYLEPYSNSPYYYPQIPNGSGGETVTQFILNTIGDSAIVDWVLLELRDKTNPTILLSTKRALVRCDGKVVSNIDGTSPVIFSNVSADDYYVSIRHRNHLGVMTANAIPLQYSTAAFVDFTTTDPVYVKPNLPGNAPYAPRKDLGNGVMGLWSGNATYNDHLIKYNGLNSDKREILTAIGFGTPGNIIVGNYRREDLNMDGTIKYGGINSGDTRIIYLNLGGTIATLGNAIYEHIP